MTLPIRACILNLCIWPFRAFDIYLRSWELDHMKCWRFARLRIFTFKNFIICELPFEGLAITAFGNWRIWVFGSLWYIIYYYILISWAFQKRTIFGRLEIRDFSREVWDLRIRAFGNVTAELFVKSCCVYAGTGVTETGVKSRSNTLEGQQVYFKLLTCGEESGKI